MASISQLNQFPCKTLSTPPCNSKFTSRPSVFSIKTTTSICRPTLSTGTRPVFSIRAVDAEDEWGPDYEDSAVAVAEEESEEKLKPTEVTEIDSLKKQLVDSFYGTDRGLKATSETRAEIVELITQLESKNPTAAPTEALTLLNGKWILAYTSFSGLFPLLSRGTLPLVKVEEISQTIDSENFTVQNSVQFSGPLATTSISTNAKFEVRSPKRVQIKFDEGIIGTPQLTDSIVLPENVEFLGQKIDLTPFKGIITSVQDTASSVAKTISSQPPLKIPISNNNAQSWLLTTYLDEDLRISRADAGSIFVLIKEGSPLLTSLTN
ncbi:plastid-lipid-associated protein, chloroplastic [Ricinus communis]|uniref:Plastid-lipid-associated protein, chloroplast, putative n=1 Tax=Ricinus communis TaxID=3988 RepID=B9SEJ1_RICCO|nr:plastid-lipid-associated protein, chloroplastic [Ricinus communis]EEF38021.1 Plastid-lipid-associated protein, chloroplast precursor, putative [Ricinus communis]|eukprot:XP_002524410.1 plastid-lipid-associated protein, chloroplastic [Ricinus communis]